MPSVVNGELEIKLRKDICRVPFGVFFRPFGKASPMGA
jgi:hypothetical protein